VILPTGQHQGSDFLPGLDNQMKHKFAHRSNPDGTVDTICTCCFQTIATVSDEAKLPKIEQEHICDPVILARFEYANLFCQKLEAPKEI